VGYIVGVAFGIKQKKSLRGAKTSKQANNNNKKQQQQKTKQKNPRKYLGIFGRWLSQFSSENSHLVNSK